MPTMLLIWLAASGFASAMYAMAAIRQFSIDFGSTALAFGLESLVGFGAIAAGAWWASGFGARIKDPIRFFGSVQLAAGLSALAGLAALALTRWLAPLALPYLFLIGTELPLIFSTRRTTARMAGLAFASNMLGAGLGILTAGFVVLPYLGMWGMAVIGAISNLAIAAVIAKKTGSIVVRPVLGSAAPQPPPNAVVGAITAIWSFSVLLYAATWMRWMAPAIGTSVWSYTLLAAMLCLGLACGFALSGWLAPKAKYPGLALALTSVAVAAVAIGSAHAMPRLPRWFVWMFAQAGDAMALFLADQAALVAAVVVPPAVLLGAIFPLVLRAERVAPARQCAIAAAAGVAGAVLGGTLLPPAIGLRGELMLAIALNIAIATAGAAWLTAWSRRQRIVVGLITASLAVMAYSALPNRDPHLFISNVYSSARLILDQGTETRFQAQERLPIDFYKESFSATIAATHAGSRRVVFADGSLRDDSEFLQPVAFEFPLTLGRPIHDVFIARLGTGAIPQALALFNVDRIDVAEPEPAIIESVRLNNSRIHIHVADPRAALNAAPRGSYDLILADTTALWMLADAKLTTREFYATAQRKLRPGGILAQTVPVPRLRFEALQSLLGTFTHTFPETLVLSSGRNATELILFGSETPFKIEWSNLLSTSRAGGINPGIMLSRILFGSREAAQLAADAAVNTDTNAVLEIASLKNLYSDHSPENGARMLAHAVDPWRYVNGAPADRRNALTEMIYSSVLTGDLDRGMKYAAELRNSGDVYDADRLSGDVLYARDQREAAVAAWTRCIKSNPKDRAVQRRLVAYYRLLMPNQRPKEYESWIGDEER